MPGLIFLSWEPYKVRTSIILHFADDEQVQKTAMTCSRPLCLVEGLGIKPFDLAGSFYFFQCLSQDLEDFHIF
jgi:hypothetical protein